MKSFIVTLAVLFITQVNAQNELCTLYGDTPVDIIIDDTYNSSDIDFSTWSGEHVHITSAGFINIDSDITLDNVTIQVDGGNKIVGTQNQFVFGKTVELKDCKVYTCSSFFTFFIQNVADVGPNVKVTNSRFEGYQECIHITNSSSFEVENSSFIGIGHAIHLDGQISNNNGEDLLIFKNNHFQSNSGLWLEELEDNLLIENNDFVNCLSHGFHMAFDDFNKNAIIKNNKFTNCGVGFTTAEDLVNQAGFDGTMIVSNNEFTDVGLAIDIGPLDGNIQINNNIMNNYSVENRGFYYGIGGFSHIFRNEINAVTTDYSNNAVIDISGIGQTVMEYNQFSGPYTSRFINVSGHQTAKLTENTSSGGGICLQGIDDLDLNSNEVDVSGFKFCYRVEQSQATLCNNAGNNGHRNYSFLGNCINSDLKSNDIGSGSVGLYVDDVIGRQNHGGNIWATTYSNEGATNTSPNVIFSLIRANNDPLQGGDVRYIPTTYSPVNWFDPDYAIGQVPNCAGPFGPHFPDDKKNLLTENDFLVINDKYNVKQLSNWLAVRNLIRKLLSNPTLLNDPVVNNWFTSYNNTNQMYISEIEQELVDYYGSDTQTDAIHTLMDDKLMVLNSLSSASSNDPAYADGMDDLADINIQLSAILTSIDASQSAKLTTINTKLQFINAPNDYELLFQDIYTVYVKYLDDVEYELLSSEITMLTEYANLCPLTYGPSLYIARAISDVYGISYDEENCNDNFIKNRSISADSNGLNIFPNPASHRITINTAATVEKIELLDLNNKALKTVKGQSSINISEYPSGLYIVRTWLADEGVPKSNLVTIMN